MSVMSVAFLLAAGSARPDEESWEQSLGTSGFEIVFEHYEDGNWDLFISKPDGSGARNLTRSPDMNEMYPQVSPDGSRIAFVADTGAGRETVRSVWVMGMDGSGLKKVADYARQPFWAPDSRVLAYLPQEYPKWNVVDYYTKGMVYYDVETGEKKDHPNAEKLHHLYNPNFSPDGKWIISTVHAGMGYGHAILLIEADGTKVFNLEIPGCRPCFSPDGTHLAWGPGDHELSVAPLDFSGETPEVGSPVLRIVDPKMKIYHIDWAPDGKSLSLSRGPNGKGDITKPNTHASACEIVGVYADGWDIFAIDAMARGTIDLSSGHHPKARQITHDGHSNKESDWVPAR
jgi:Tol biopolymer transport system component